jgi:hypothetical protein
MPVSSQQAEGAGLRQAASSRHFEAVGTKTCQIMFRGRFNDILAADRHYLALATTLPTSTTSWRSSPTSERQTIVEQAHAHVMEAHT